MGPGFFYKQQPRGAALKKLSLMLLWLCLSAPTTNAAEYHPGDIVVYRAPGASSSTAPGNCFQPVQITETAQWSHNPVTPQTQAACSGTKWYQPQNYILSVCALNKNTNTYQWNSAYLSSFTYLSSEAYEQISEAPQVPANLSGANCVARPTCQQGDGDPLYVGLPYDAEYYAEVGICVDNCKQIPSGVTLSDYADDGSGFSVGPWYKTGEPCEPGVTGELPPQPTPEKVAEAGESLCQAKCQGRAYQYDPATGACECFGPPTYTTDPPLQPTTPTTDPGSPSVPGAQTPATDPGGDPQLSAQISNQSKQIGQGDAQLGQLGGINDKLGAVIDNQGKQIGQADKANDYARRQLGVLEDMRNQMAKEANADVPGLPGEPNLDGSIPDTKNWGEYDNAQSVGQAQGEKQIDITEANRSENPFSLAINTSGADPCLSGPLLGTTIDICFNRPWMLTGYAIMNGIFISVGYLQAFLMIQKVVTGA